jgi:hypothetical protein
MERTSLMIMPVAEGAASAPPLTYYDSVSASEYAGGEEASYVVENP